MYIPVTGKLLMPATTEIARIIAVADKDIGPEYNCDAVVGRLPSVVK